MTVAESEHINSHCNPRIQLATYKWCTIHTCCSADIQLLELFIHRIVEGKKGQNGCSSQSWHHKKASSSGWISDVIYRLVLIVFKYSFFFLADSKARGWSKSLPLMKEGMEVRVVWLGSWKYFSQLLEIHGLFLSVLPSEKVATGMHFDTNLCD